jgi:hypothetical protein
VDRERHEQEGDEAESRGCSPKHRRRQRGGTSAVKSGSGEELGARAEESERSRCGFLQGRVIAF